MANRETKPSAGDETARRLATDAAELVRQEVDRLRTEAVTVVRRAGVGGGLVAGGGVFGLLALYSGSATILRTLETVLPPQRAAWVLTLGYLGAASVLGGVGIAQLRDAGLLSRRAVSEARRELTEE